MEPISNLRALERAARDARISDVAALAGAHAQQGYTPDARRLRVAHDVVADTLRSLERNRALLPAERNQKGGDRSAAYLCAALSAWSYSDAQTLCDVAYRLGFGEDARCYPLSVHNSALFVDAQAFYLRSGNGKLAVLAFRGTELVSLVDWLTDFQNLPAPDLGKHGFVHAGFLASLMPIWDPIVRFVTDPETRAEQLLITGHSLGGALAAITALTLAEFGHVALRAPGVPRLAGIYTFGQPMVGDPAFAEWAEGQLGALSFRYVNDNDLIPRLPSRFEGKYRHFGMLHTASAKAVAEGKGGFEFQPPAPDESSIRRPELPAALGVLIGAIGYIHKRALPFLPLPPLPASLDAHSPLEYVAIARSSAYPELAFP